MDQIHRRHHDEHSVSSKLQLGEKNEHFICTDSSITTAVAVIQGGTQATTINVITGEEKHKHAHTRAHTHTQIDTEAKLACSGPAG